MAAPQMFLRFYSVTLIYIDTVEVILEKYDFWTQLKHYLLCKLHFHSVGSNLRTVFQTHNYFPLISGDIFVSRQLRTLFVKTYTKIRYVKANIRGINVTFVLYEIDPCNIICSKWSNILQDIGRNYCLNHA